MKDIVITSNPAEMTEIGRQLFKKRRLLTKYQVNAIKETILHFMPDASEEERENFFFQYYYDYIVYGFNVDQEFYLHLIGKTHEEKSTYLTHNNKFLYYARMNKRSSMHILEDKYEAYELLKPYYGREMIKIESEEDYPKFLEYIEKHPVFVVKPISLSNGLGIRKVDANDYADKHQMFMEMLGASTAFEQALDYTWSTELTTAVLEEVIEQDESLAVLHPASVNGVRVTTVRVNGEVHIYYPWIKVAVGGEFVASATLGGFDAGIDPETGIINTNGYLEDGNYIEYHPDSKVKILGFQIPKWDELVKTAKEVANLMDPSINYVGWDFVLTPNGWVIMEGNFYGDTMWQMCYQKGMKEDFENLIGWKPEKQYWWQYSITELEQ